ncbi:MAG: hypothetical protein WA317_18460 [Mycobacterium sp.]|uniref:hypothetical protein n=1 Tax=Mycobacterium sp. TaxID=1785 RepID=UPI003CC64B9D
MAREQQAHEVPSPGQPAGFAPLPEKSAQVAAGNPRVIRLRLAPWDVLCTVVLMALLIVLATTTDWPSRLFGFLADVCTDDTCAPAPFGIDFYIYPVVWGGVGAAFAAVTIGPLVSLVKGWYMSFWPVLAVLVVIGAAVAGAAITAFSNNYWHENPGAAVAARLPG